MVPKTFRFFTFFLVCAFVLSCTATIDIDAPAKNIIFFIGDGMGPEQEDAASIYLTGTAGSLSFEQFPVHSRATTFSANNSITDSAASATAIATGQKVNNGVISEQIPGNRGDIPTILEIYKNSGYYTGLVSTAYITHATPAAFGAHVSSRIYYNLISNDFFGHSMPNLLLGGGGNGISAAQAETAGYYVVENLSELQHPESLAYDFISGQFGDDHIPYEYDGLGTLPSLSDMTEFALDFMNDKGDYFFLMIEGARIDHACHNNDIVRAVHEAIEFSNAVEIARNWAENRNDTIIIVTADHETGGLEVIQNRGQGVLPDVRWSTTGHTSTPVNVYAWGTGADEIRNVEDNTNFFSILLNL